MTAPLVLTFLGDFACPAGLTPRVAGLERVPLEFSIVNLEGGLRPPDWPLPPAGPTGVVLYTAREALPLLNSWNVRVATLANNHIDDLHRPLGDTIRELADAGIATCGAGETLGAAARPAVVLHAGRKLAFLAFGWEPIECVAATATTSGVNPLRPRHVLASVEQTRRDHPDALLVVLFHWDYELEIYPLPAQRQLAQDAITAGADAVVGHHPHCAQGFELHQGKPIVYSLGNWFLPHGTSFGVPIRYPDYSLRQLVWEWRPDHRRSVGHWFDYDPAEHVIRHVASEPVDDSAEMRSRTPFAGMSHRQYVRWFRRNRRKRRGLPVYADHRHELRNALYDRWNALRMRLLRAWRGKVR